MSSYGVTAVTPIFFFTSGQGEVVVERILREFKRFLSVPGDVEELVVERYVGRLVERNLTIVSGFPVCILNLLDEAMVPYEHVFELVVPYSVVVVVPELAEKIVEAMGRTEGIHGPLFISTCYIGESCIYHVHDARRLDLDFIAKHIVILRHINNILFKYILLGRCKGENPATIYINCLKQLASDLSDIARREESKWLARILNDPFKVYCTPDIVMKHESR